MFKSRRFSLLLISLLMVLGGSTSDIDSKDNEELKDIDIIESEQYNLEMDGNSSHGSTPKTAGSSLKASGSSSNASGSSSKAPGSSSKAPSSTSKSLDDTENELTSAQPPTTSPMPLQAYCAGNNKSSTVPGCLQN